MYDSVLHVWVCLFDLMQLFWPVLCALGMSARTRVDVLACSLCLGPFIRSCAIALALLPGEYQKVSQLK